MERVVDEEKEKERKNHREKVSSGEAAKRRGGNRSGQISEGALGRGVLGNQPLQAVTSTAGECLCDLRHERERERGGKERREEEEPLNTSAQDLHCLTDPH